MFEQTFEIIDDFLRRWAGCAIELHYTDETLVAPVREIFEWARAEQCDGSLGRRQKYVFVPADCEIWCTTNEPTMVQDWVSVHQSGRARFGEKFQ